MARKVDLHLHTTASDGTLSPAALVAAAKAVGIGTLAVADHDTVAALAAARAAGLEQGVEVISGIELSADYHGTGVHILGYGIDEGCSDLRQVLDWVIEQRSARNERIAALMRADGVPVCVAELERKHPGATIGRPHFARVLVEKGRAESVAEAFRLWLNRGRPYHQPRVRLSLERAIQAIGCSGGLAVLAHPLQYRFTGEQLYTLVEKSVALGVGGMEIYYTGYGPEQREMLHALAREFGLIVTGGSDFHGVNKPDIRLGELQVPGDILPPLRAKLARVRG